MKKVLFLFLLLLLSFSLLSGKERISVDEENLTVFLKNNRLVVRLLVNNKTHRDVFGKFQVEIIDKDDQILTEGKEWFNLKWKEQEINFSFPYKHVKKKLYLQRLKYYFIFRRDTVEGIVSLSQVLPQLETHILGHSEFIEGSRAALRIVTHDYSSGEPIEDAKVEIFLKTKVMKKRLFIGQTDRYGTVDVYFKIPEGIKKGELEITTRTPFGEDKVVQNINIKKGTLIYLVTDKPIYQPNQKIHIRTLSLKKPDLYPIKKERILIEVEDPKGNKVFKNKGKTDEFGVASTVFQLADEINFGEYKISVTIGDITENKIVTVNKYILPKFKIEFITDKKYYLPGEKLRGVISVKYFFGKPVAGGDVKARCKKFDVDFSTFEEIDGTTDRNGKFEFKLKVPREFVKIPLEDGKTFIQFELEVKDKSGYIEQTTKRVKAAKDRIRITVVPESGELVPNLRNRIYLMTTYPDGKPAKTKLTVKIDGVKKKIETNEIGIAQIHLTPKTGGVKKKIKTNEIGIVRFRLTPTDIKYNISVTAVDRRGVKGTLKKEFKIEEKEDGILLRTDRSLCKVGENVMLNVFTTKKRGMVYVDVIKNNQTILTKSLEVKGGNGTYSLDLTRELSGSIWLSAYMITRRGDIMRDTKVLYVNPANDLNIGIELNKETYKPGEEAKLDFSITDKKRKGCAAVLGVAVVDEAVFGLTELKPGMEKVYFTLEKELVEPKYEIYWFTPEFIVGSSEQKMIRRKKLLDEASNLFFASCPSPGYDFFIGTYKDKAKKLRENAIQMVAMDKVKLRNAVWEYRRKKKKYPDKEKGIKALLTCGFLKKKDLMDPWGVPYQVSFIDERGRFELVSSGADKLFNTADDIKDRMLKGMGIARIVKVTQKEGKGTTGEIIGKVFDVQGEHLPFANVFILGTTMGAVTAINGDYFILNIPPGVYNVQARMMGFHYMTMKNVKVKANSRTEIEFNLPMEMIEMPGTTISIYAKTIIEPDVTSSKVESKALRDERTIKKPVEEPMVRRYFPETLLFKPSLITDKNGKASLKLKLADSITRWRMSISSSSKKGELGSAEKGIRVFQDFFADLDLPVALTEGDEISFPVALYNYLPTPQKIELKLEENGWFKLLDEPTKRIELKKDEVAVVYFRIRAKELGYHKLLVKAYGEYISDAIEKGIEVVPDGKAHFEVLSDRLTGDVDTTVVIPKLAIDDASKIFVRIYPGIISQIVGGLDALLRMPHGCFEQTSSVTFPNILVLDYMRKTKQVTSELEQKAEEYINQGYQCLLSFEVKGGGFSLYGKSPANKLLTAYGLMEFKDMSKVYEIDERIIDRTIEWLLSKQERNGSFISDRRVWRKFQGREVLSTAYVTWALLEAGTRNAKIDKAIEFIKDNLEKVEDPYTLSLCANALVSYNRNDVATKRVFKKLFKMKVMEEDKVYWTPAVSSITNSRGKGAQIENTALVCYALIKYGRYGDVVNRALTYLIQSKNPHGRWCSTQATILALRALLASLGAKTEKTDGWVVININGKEYKRIKITPQNSDVVRVIDLEKKTREGDNRIELLFKGEGNLFYEIVSKYYLPWRIEPEPLQKLLTIDVEYDKKKLVQNDIVGVEVNVRNNMSGTAELVIVDIGVPPGFQVFTPDLDELVEKKKIEKYSLTGRQIIIYLDRIESGKLLNFTYRLRAKYPLLAKTGQSRVYEYYNPDVEAIEEPFEIEVK